MNKLTTLLIACFLQVVNAAFATIAATAVFEVRTTGSDTNGGGFTPGASGTDRSQQDAAQYSVTDGVTAGSTTITSATAAFGTDVVGNIVYVQGGTGAVVAGWYEIITRTNATTIVVDRSTGLTAGTGVTLKIGGALASPGLAAGLTTGAARHVWVKAGTYTINVTTANVASGRIAWAGSATQTAIFEGYTTTRGDTTTSKPILLASGISGTYMITCGNNSTVRNIDINSNSTSVGGISLGTADRAEDCIVRNSTAIGYLSSISAIINCKASSCATGFQPTTAGTQVWMCVAESCTTYGFHGSGTNGNFVSCLDNASAIGFDMTVQGGGAWNCTAYGGTSHGFDLSDTGCISLVNCIAYGRGGVGFRNGAAGTYRNNQMINCAGGNNTTSNNNWALDASMNRGFITLSADPFTNKAGGDFSLNSTVGGGALLKALGYPTTMPLTTTPQTLDVGAAQTLNSSPAAIVTVATGFGN